MLGPHNYIAFLTVVGFFIGTSFGILKADDAGMMLFWPLVVTLIFYILAVASSSYFIGIAEVKKNVFLDTEAFEYKYDTLARNIAAREVSIKESLDFRKEVELEDTDEFNKKMKKGTTK